MVEVFVTNIEEPVLAARVVKLLLEYFPDHRINFDLNDCDKILRVEAVGAIKTDTVISVVRSAGFLCHLLEDTVPVYYRKALGSSISL